MPRKQPLAVQWSGFVCLNLQGILNFICIFLLWFSITSPVPSKNLGSALFTMQSKNAASILSKASGKSKAIFDQLEETDAGMWVGIFGSCGRSPGGPLNCSPVSFTPDYNSSFSQIRFVTSDLLFNEIYSTPAAPVPVWIVCVILMILSSVLSVLGNFPHYGSEGSTKVSQRWNRMPGVWRLKYWIVVNQKGKWMLGIALGFLCSAWILGLTAAIAIHQQWFQVVEGWNLYYGQLLAEIVSTSSTLPTPASGGPILLAASQSSVWFEQWFCWTLMALNIIAVFYSYHKFPTAIPVYPTGEGKKDSNADLSDIGSSGITEVKLGKNYSNFGSNASPRVPTSNFSYGSTVHSTSTSKTPSLKMKSSGSSDAGSIKLNIDAFDRVVDLSKAHGDEQRKPEVWV